MTHFIWVKGRKYYYYDSYYTRKQALHVAKIYRKINKDRYFIMKGSEGYLFPSIKYKLYLTKTMPLRF